MDTFKEFLEYSSINGMSLISNTRRFSRLFWILIVLGGFVCATYLIFESFDNWKEKPITTTIETLPISELTLPNVTVCPPRGLFLNLNHDIKESENITLNKDLRKELLDYALDVILDQYYNEAMANLSKIQDPDRYYNWYHGYTEVTYPYDSYSKQQLYYYVETTAPSGNISTQYFGDKFEADKVDANIYIDLFIYVLASGSFREKNRAIMINLEKITINQYRSNDYTKTFPDGGAIDAGIMHWSRNYSIAELTKFDDDYQYFRFYHNRYLSEPNILTVDLNTMPGFRFTWKYNARMEPDDVYLNYSLKNMAFVRFGCTYVDT